MTRETEVPLLELDAPSTDFDAFFLARYDGLVRTLGAAFGDREQAAEAVQEAFVRAYTRWRRISRLDNPFAWVRRVAINLLRDQYRRSGRGERAVERLAAITPSQVPGADNALTDSTLNHHLSTLPPQQRIALALFYLQDASIADVAHAMSISEGTVKYHLNQGRSSLRRALELSGGA